jgi:hypothetical protein
MKLGDARAAYEALSGKASDIVRQLSLAGVGLIWLFKTGTGSPATLDIHLLRAALFIFLALLFDFFSISLAQPFGFSTSDIKKNRAQLKRLNFKPLRASTG